jgi:hypothetical protein
LGHWITEGGTHYYYGENGKFISVYSGKAHSGKYYIEEMDEKERTLRIRVSYDHFRILTFSPEKDEVSDIAELMGKRSEKAFNWKYIDDAKQPSADLIKNTATDEMTFEVTTNSEGPEFFVGDKKTKVYYTGNCRNYDKLSWQRKVYFYTEKEARRAGYRATKGCP